MLLGAGRCQKNSGHDGRLRSLRLEKDILDAFQQGPSCLKDETNLTFQTLSRENAREAFWSFKLLFNTSLESCNHRIDG